MNAYNQLLAELRSGEAIDEYGQELAKLVLAVRLTGKPGTITLAIAVKPASKGDASALIIGDKLTVKTPRMDTADTIMYGTEEGELVRRDPRQPDMMSLRDASAPPSDGKGIAEPIATAE